MQALEAEFAERRRRVYEDYYAEKDEKIENLFRQDEWYRSHIDELNEMRNSQELSSFSEADRADLQALEAEFDERRKEYIEKYNDSLILKDEEKSKKVHVSEDEVDAMMNEIYAKTDKDNSKTKKPEIEIPENEVDAIMNSIYQDIDDENKKASALEVIFNEANDVITDMNKFIASHEDYLDYDLDEMIEWTKNSITIFEKLKSDLEKDYKGGNKLALSFLKPEGGYEIKFTENDEIYYNRQMDYLNGMIKSCQELENKLTKPLEKTDDIRCVIFRVGDDVCVVSNGLKTSDVQKLDSDIIHGAVINGYRVKLYNCPKEGAYRINGITVNMDENGVMTFDGTIDEIEFYNHPENYKVNNPNSELLNKFIELTKNNDIDAIQKLIEENEAELLWKEVARRITEGTMTEDDFRNLAEYLSTIFERPFLISNKVFLNDTYQSLVKKYPLFEPEDEDEKDDEKDDDKDKTTKLLNPSLVLNQLIVLTKKGDKEKIAELVMLCRPDQIWKELMNRLDNKTMDMDMYQEFMNKFPSLLPSDYKDIIMGQATYYELIKKYPVKQKENDTEKAGEKEKEDDGKAVPLKPVPVKKHVKNRKEKKSLLQKFKDLKKWQKVALVAGAAVAGVAIVGLGVYHFVPGAAAAINAFFAGGHQVDPTPVNHVTTTPIGNKQPGNTPFNDWIQNLKNFIHNNTQNVQTLTNGAGAGPAAIPEAVDYGSVGQGHTIFADAFNAVSGTNPLTANEWFSNNPVGVFNTVTNQYLNVTPEQLHNVDFLRQLAQDPNNAVLFGSSINNPDGFIPVVDLVGEVIKGGKVL